MAIETKGGVLKSVSDGKAVVKLATLFAVDKDNDVLESNFFPTSPPLKVSIQPYHKHDVPSMGHAYVKEVGHEVLATFEFNDSQAAQEMWKVLQWDYAHPPPIQEFSWAFLPKPGSARQGMFDGRSVRLLGKAGDGSHGVDLVEAGPVLRGASVNSRLISVRSQGTLSQSQQSDVRRLKRRLDEQLADRQAREQREIRSLFGRWLKRELAFALRR